MINTLIDAIANKIMELFEDVAVHTDKAPQDFVTSSFYIKCISHSDNILLFDNRRKAFTFDIVYFPAENSLTAQEEMNNVLAVLAENMHFINIGDKVIKDYDVETNRDEELHYIVTYKFIALKDDEDINMEILKERTGVNG
ncbi:MAG: hypothetical protein Q4D26_09200 [Clostridia bacterium]|nr:hypothetical protein [Clostridia bacterium]